MAANRKIPWWSGFPLSAGIGGMSAFADTLPAWVQASGFVVSAALFVGGLVATAGHFGWAFAFRSKYPDRHKEVLQAVALPIATVQEQALTYAPRDHEQMRAAKSAAEALVSEIPYDSVTADAVRTFIQACYIASATHDTADEFRKARNDVTKMAPYLFQCLHGGKGVDRRKVNWPDWWPSGSGKEVPSLPPEPDQPNTKPTGVGYARPQIRAERLIESSNGVGEKTLWLEIGNPNEQEATGLVARLVDANPPLMEAGRRGLGLPRVLATKGRLDRFRTGAESPIPQRPFNLAPHDKKQIEIFRAPRFNGVVARITGEAGETDFILSDQELTVEVVGGGRPVRVVIPIKLDPTNGTWSATLISEAAGEAHGEGGIGRRS